ncbi:hypothetical protein SAMN05216456_1321 [Devosia crocina]|uniref:DUF4376 domain-containing protein n=1 Tax=Devosia crocina TaxID=429728 RepID=A0A1I7N9J7_9HYPH|nr:hypothetical protein [Devosia crocina]SFV31374.1 hypothetical protein SAMN05216456_1321 [Devosia crocina]
MNTTLYALVENGIVTRTGSRPKWKDENGQPVSDAVLRAGGYQIDDEGKVLFDADGNKLLATDRPGWFPVREHPQYDVHTSRLVVFSELAHWPVNVDDVGPTAQVIALSPEEQKHALQGAQSRAIERIKSVGARLMSEGFAYDFGGEVGVQHLQLRDADDKANWLTAKDKMRDAIAAGYGDAPVAPMRTAENNTPLVTPNQGVVILSALSNWAEQMFATSWAKQDAIRSATDISTFKALEASIEEGWPV